MGRRRKPNKKTDDSNAPTPTPEDVDEADVSITEQVVEPTQTEAPPPAAPAAELVKPAGEKEEQGAKDEERVASLEPSDAPSTIAARLEAEMADTPADNSIEKPAETPAPTASHKQQPSTPEAAPVDGVAALNAYALENASGAASPSTTASPPSEERKDEKLPSGEESSASTATPRRSSTKRVAFITPVISSITSPNDIDPPRESNCIEARCGSCNVM